MAKSLQEIEDYYLSKGLKGEDLRTALDNDSEYQALLKERKSVIRNKYGITEVEEKEFILPSEEDYEILSYIKSLEMKQLTKKDKEIVKLIKSQLQADWRAPLLTKLREFVDKYKRF